MRARNIKPGFYRNADLAECSLQARYIVPGLWMLADREGRLRDKPKQIKLELCPVDDVDIDKLLGELEQVGHIIRYQAEGKRYIQIRKFLKHQKPHKHEPKSEIPPLPDENSGVESCTDMYGHDNTCTDKTSHDDTSTEMESHYDRSRPDSLNAECGMLNAEEEDTSASASVSFSPTLPLSNNGVPVKDIAEAWNQALASNRAPPPRITKVSPNTNRYKHIRARWKELPDLAAWRDLFDRVTKSEFLRNANWFSFDWLVKSPDNFRKALEGNYDNKEQGNAQSLF